MGDRMRQVEPEIKVKSLASAMRLLDCFTPTTPELGISTLSEMTGLVKSNVHSILSTFAVLGYIEKTDSNKYRLGAEFLRLANVISRQKGFREAISPHMQELARHVGETVYLGQLRGDKVLYLDAAYPEGAINMRSILGETADLHCTGIGKALLATVPEAQIWEHVNRPMKAYTGATIVDETAFLNEIVAVRARGYAIDNMEHEFGVKCVAHAIINRSGETIGAISLSGPSLRFDEQSIPAFAQVLAEKARIIGEQVLSL